MGVVHDGIALVQEDTASMQVSRCLDCARQCSSKDVHRTTAHVPLSDRLGFACVYVMPRTGLRVLFAAVEEQEELAVRV
jgi:hypothetical protein